MNQTTKPHTYVADITQLPRALQYITGQKRWVVWRWELRKRKNGAIAWTKPPYQCGIRRRRRNPMPRAPGVPMPRRWLRWRLGALTASASC